MKQNWKWVLVIVACLGWLLDFLFWRQGPGGNFSLYALLCLAGGLVALRLDPAPPASDRTGSLASISAGWGWERSGSCP